VSVFNQSRKNVIMLVFIGLFVIIFMQLINLQLFSTKYRIDADNQGTFRKVIYPDRGIVFDRKGKSILQNTVIYDLMVIPGKIKGTDFARY
jgi:penicillin-binding protein 2